MARTIKPTHPGKILLEEFLNPLNISRYKAAKDTDIKQMTLYEICNGKRSITSLNSIILSKYLGLNEDYFSVLQNHYDYVMAKIENKKRIEKISTCDHLSKTG